MLLNFSFQAVQYTNQLDVKNYFIKVDFYRKRRYSALLPHLIQQLGSAHEWSGVWTGP